MKISDLKQSENNPRFIKDDKFERLKKSIEDFPKGMALRPIIVDQDNVILGGNMRYKALVDLGYKELPEGWVRKADDLTEEEKQRFIITDNANFGEWDWEILANEWDSDDLKDFGLDVWGANDFEPELNPDTDSNVITQEDIEKAEGNMDAQSQVASTIDCICPKCAHEFKINNPK